MTRHGSLPSAAAVGCPVWLCHSTCKS